MNPIDRLWRHRSEVLLISGASAGFVVAIISALSDQVSIRGIQITILAVVSLLLAGEVLDRFGRLDKIEKDVAAIARPRPGDFLQQRGHLKPLQDRCEGAKSIRVCGVTLRDSAEYRRLFLGLLKGGAQLEFLVCNQQQIDTWTIGNSYDCPADVLKANIKGTLGTFRDIRDEAKKNGYRGSIQWRHPRVPPRLSMLHIDIGLPTERLRVELQPHGLDGKSRPSFELSVGDPWLSEFCRVSNEMWDEARPG